MADLPSVSDFFGGTPASPPQPGNAPQDSGLPSVQDFFGNSDKMVGSYSGAANDTVWSSTYDAGARILNATGYGAQSHWGTQPLGLSPENEASLRKAGIFNDYVSGNESFLKSANEAIMRPTVAGADLAMRLATAPFYAAGAELAQTAKEIQGERPTALRTAIAAPFGAAGEFAGAIPEGGYLPEGQIHSPQLTEINKARAVGVIGEGEEGFHETSPVSPENAQARANAAKESGLPEQPPIPPPDVHTLARRIDPETFATYDDLANRRQQYGDELERLTEEHESSLEVQEAHEKVDAILDKVGGVEDKLTNAGVDHLNQAQSDLDKLLATDTDEMRQDRFQYGNMGQQMQPLYESVQSAYRRAQDLLPPEEVIAESAKPQAEGKEEGAEGEKEAEAATPSVQQPGLQEPPMALPEGLAEAPQILQEAKDQETGGNAPNVVGDEKLGSPSEAKQPTSRYGSVKPVEGTGEKKARGLSEGVEAKAIENSLIKSFGDLPEYQRVSMADQAAKSADYIAKDYEGAKAVAMGQKSPPKGVLPESVFVAVEKKALAEGDVETLRKLATSSRLATEATTMGQRIRTLGERDQASPVGAIQEVQRAREEAFKAREKTDIPTAKKKAVAEAKAEIRKAAPKQDWNSFIQSIKCN